MSGRWFRVNAPVAILMGGTRGIAMWAIFVR